MKKPNQTTLAYLSAQQKIFNICVLLLICAIVLPFLGKLLLDFVYSFSSFESITLIAKRFYWYIYNSVTSSPFTLILFPFIFVLQYLFPAVKKQACFNRAVTIDAIYSVTLLLFYFAVAPKFFAYLKASFILPTIGIWNISVNDLPYYWQLLLGYLAVDFLGWLHHLIRHKVPVFWAIHAVHHSQKELNPFSNERIHILDWIISNIIKFVPALFFNESLGIILNYIVIHRFLDHLNHSNIKTNLGPLKYIFVTPQSHRVHHSSEREFFDKNFGVSLSIWDHLFGTQCKNYNAYPKTGVPDESFPNEQCLYSCGLIKTFIKQQIYPFKKIYNYLKN